MAYTMMTSTTFNEAKYISAALEKIYYDYSTRIDRIILDHYMLEIGHDLEKEAALLESYRNEGKATHGTLYDILYFKVNKAIDGEEMESYYQVDHPSYMN